MSLMNFRFFAQLNQSEVFFQNFNCLQTISNNIVCIFEKHQSQQVFTTTITISSMWLYIISYILTKYRLLVEYMTIWSNCTVKDNSPMNFADKSMNYEILKGDYKNVYFCFPQTQSKPVMALFHHVINQLYY